MQIHTRTWHSEHCRTPLTYLRLSSNAAFAGRGSNTYKLFRYEYYKNRVDKMESVKIDHVAKEVREIFGIGRKDHLLSKFGIVVDLRIVGQTLL
jgi:hypothetical protein